MHSQTDYFIWFIQRSIQNSKFLMLLYPQGPPSIKYIMKLNKKNYYDLKACIGWFQYWPDLGIGTIQGGSQKQTTCTTKNIAFFNESENIFTTRVMHTQPLCDYPSVSFKNIPCQIHIIHYSPILSTQLWNIPERSHSQSNWAWS